MISYLYRFLLRKQSITIRIADEKGREPPILVIYALRLKHDIPTALLHSMAKKRPVDQIAWFSGDEPLVLSSFQSLP